MRSVDPNPSTLIFVSIFAQPNKKFTLQPGYDFRELPPSHGKPLLVEANINFSNILEALEWRWMMACILVVVLCIFEFVCVTSLINTPLQQLLAFTRETGQSFKTCNYSNLQSLWCRDFYILFLKIFQKESKRLLFNS
jgi:hypothetical protein